MNIKYVVFVGSVNVISTTELMAGTDSKSRPTILEPIHALHVQHNHKVGELVENLQDVTTNNNYLVIYIRLIGSILIIFSIV